jgi:gluconolactonase
MSMDELIAPGAQVRRLGTGLRFTEGPVWNHAGAYLLFSDIPDDTRRRWSESEGVTTVASPNNKGNGMVYDAEGRLLICEHATSSLVRQFPDGVTETLVGHFGGRELNSPNDVVTRSDGSIYFTDPTYGRSPGFGVEREPELAHRGVYRMTAATSEPMLVVDPDRFDQPNGLCFSPDESLLYVNDTPGALVRVYDVGADGSLSGERLFCDAIGGGEVDEGAPDGMKCDAGGNIWVTGPGGVSVISPAGARLGVLEVPETVANLAWGGDDWHTLFLTASTSLYCVSTRVGPAPLPYHPR